MHNDNNNNNEKKKIIIIIIIMMMRMMMMMMMIIIIIVVATRPLLRKEKHGIDIDISYPNQTPPKSGYKTMIYSYNVQVKT